MRGTQLARQWKIIRLLESRKRGLTAAELSSELETAQRTIYRDLEAIQEAGFPVYTDRKEKRSYWKLIEGFKTDLPLPVTATELMSLHMSQDILKVFEGTIFQASIDSLLRKVRTSLPKETIRYLDNLSGRLRVGFGPSKDYRSFKEMIALASDATARNKQVAIVYKAASTGRESTRKIDPYQVWAMNGSFYLIGLCHLRRAVRTFAMDRIKKLVVLDDSFHFPKEFSLEDYLQTAFRVMRGDSQTVKVSFAPGAAQVVRERIWHPTQEIREQPDGSLVITLEVPINYEVTSWIMGFGSAAKVLGPTSLQKRIQEEHQAAAQRYRTGRSAMTKIVRSKKIQASLS